MNATGPRRRADDSGRGDHGPGCGLARALSKLGFCSRSAAWRLIEARQIRVNGKVQLDPEHRVILGRDRIEVNDRQVRPEARVYLMLNKPRGLVATASDEQGRETVFECFAGQTLPFVSPVGRLDKASEGLLLFTNDTAWAAAIAAPESHLEKTYHLQVDRIIDEPQIQRIGAGVTVDGERLAVKRVRVLRHGGKNCWLEIILDEGRNRHLRRLLEALGIQVLRLMRVAIGSLQLGALAKGASRPLTTEEVNALAGPSAPDLASGPADGARRRGKPLNLR